MANDNVLKFPDGGRPSAPAQSLTAARDLMARRLREGLRLILAEAKRDLLLQGEQSNEPGQRKFLYDTHDALMERSGRLESLLAVNWQREFDAAASGAPSHFAVTTGVGLRLMDPADLDESLVLRNLAAQLREACEEDVYASGCRLGVLAGRRNESAEFNPAAPEVVGRALAGALREAGFATAQRIVLLRCAEKRAAADLGPAYGDLNGYLLRLGLLPNLKRAYAAAKPAQPAPTASASASKPAVAEGDVFALLQRLVAATPGRGGGSGLGGGSGGVQVAPEQVWASLDTLQRLAVAGDAGGMLAPAVNSLHEFRASPVGRSLGEFDAVTVDIVAMLFDLIFNDKSISDPIKSLVGRMQIPVLKVAMLDKGFFASGNHPARRLLDGISRAAVRWGATVDHADPLYRQVAKIVERVRAEFGQDTSLFETLCGELEAFLGFEEQAAESRAARAAPLVARREQEEISAQVARRMVAAWMAEPLPPVLADLFQREWRALLVRHHLEGDDAGWGAAVRVAGDLIWSVQPKKDAAARKALVAKLPALVRELQEGLGLVGAEAERRLALTDALFGLHATVLRGGDVPEPSIQEPVVEEAELTSSRLEADDLVVESISAAAGAGEVDREVEELKRGDWVEFALGDQGSQRYRLSWVSPQRGVLLFTNPQSPRAIAVSPAALALQIRRGEAAVLRVEPVFERAVNRALETLQAA